MTADKLSRAELLIQSGDALPGTNEAAILPAAAPSCYYLHLTVWDAYRLSVAKVVSYYEKLGIHEVIW